MISDEMVHRFYRALRDDDRHPDSYAALRSALAAVAEELAERIAAAIDADAADIVNGITEDEYVHGVYDGLGRGANFARRRGCGR
jgi:hypothetical protein